MVQGRQLEEKPYRRDQPIAFGGIPLNTDDRARIAHEERMREESRERLIRGWRTLQVMSRIDKEAGLSRK